MNEKIKKLTELRNSMWEPKLEFMTEVYFGKYRYYWMSENIHGALLFRPENGGTSRTTIDGSIERRKDYRILGTPISITNILRMLNEKQRKFVSPDYDRYILTMYGELQEWDTAEYEFIQTIVEFDISKGDYIKDQSQEVIDKLLDLFNIK